MFVRKSITTRIILNFLLLSDGEAERVLEIF